ncbi:MAG TPA: hypothetical protein VNX01_08885 [Bacteroidia bacterium]|jgi:hypothetical protein|nr:hypothetical protein [Bacteroidia bacterium]
MSVTNDLIEINELLDLLGYSDLRSVRKFCMENKIPLFNLGKKTYTINNFLDAVIANEFSKNYSNADKILQAINDDDKAALANLIDAPTEQKVNTKFKKHKTNSSAAEKLLKKLNEA